MSAVIQVAPLERDPFGNFLIPKYEFSPVYIGPSWRLDDKGDPELPDFSLGWQAIQWAEDHLLNDKAEPWRFTGEQKRLLLWWFAVDERGVFLFRDGILQRIKGWGKDPFLAAICLIELIGPCRFKGWAKNDVPSKGIAAGDPIATDNPTAWIQIAAVSKTQTQNTMLCFAWMIPDDTKKKYRMTINKESVFAYGGRRKIQAVTSNPRALEGSRPSLVVKNETHQWVASNDGHAMSEVIERNLTKSSGGTARAMSITNAYAPHESSVAQRQREAYEAELAGLAISTGVFYDSIEADPSISLAPPKPPRPEEMTEDEFRDFYGEMTKAWLATMIEGVRGDAKWLNIERIVASMLDGQNPISLSKRFWLNVITTSEDTWVANDAIKAAIALGAIDAREHNPDKTRAAWSLVMPDEEIVMFGDGSKSDDSTGLVGCRLSDGFVFEIGVWQKPPKERGKEAVESWLAPRAAVDLRVREAFKRFKIVAFWFDPSHVKDDVDQSSYWQEMCDNWMRDLAPRLPKATWASRTGQKGHAILFDMTSPERQALFVNAAMTFVQEMENKNDIEEYHPRFQICGSPALVNHLRNAVKWPTKWGESLAKEGRESAKKIDLAVCAVGARMLRRIYLNTDVEVEKPRSGSVWGA